MATRTKTEDVTTEHPPTGPLYGVVAEFDDPHDLMHAVEKAKEAGFGKMDAFSPFPIHGLTEAMGWKCHKVPWSIFFGGLTGGLIGLGLQTWVNKTAYPMNVGGRPQFSWPSFIPVTYECTILIASLTAFLGALAFNGLPKPYHPVFDTPNFDHCSQDKFFLCLEAGDGFDSNEAQKFLKGLKPVNVSEVFAEEEGNWSL